NVIKPDCSIITSISLEHTQYLGHTLSSIAAEKAGIIKPGVPVVTAAEQPEVLEVIRRGASANGAALRIVVKDIDYHLVSSTQEGTIVKLSGLPAPVKLPLLGGYQAVNAATAYTAAIELDRRGIEVVEHAMIAGLEKVRWAGRLELLQTEPRMILDASHTPEGACKVAMEVEKLFGNDLTLVIGVLNDKDLEGVVGPFARIASSAIATSPATERAYAANEVALALNRHLKDVEIESNVPHAIARAIEKAGSGGVVLITGSIYTIGEAKAWLESYERPV
ncbi:MAG: hypothetical protein LUO85_03410, partial [Methanomassiliicoccales archaeon]|nr:hypothetical protein [Methanomassiliicoccales archaeon]